LPSHLPPFLHLLSNFKADKPTEDKEEKESISRRRMKRRDAKRERGEEEEERERGEEEVRRRKQEEKDRGGGEREEEECATEAVFCYTPKNPQFQEEKISVRRKARSHVTLEKSSKNYISLCEGKPSPHPSASRYRTFYMWWTTSVIRKCKVYSRESPAGGGGGGRGDFRSGAIP
jgi:hypothetical protein